MRLDYELAALARVLSIKLVRDCLVIEGKTAKRLRRLPPEMVFWLVVGMGLHRDRSIRNVLSVVASGLGDELGWTRADAPHSTSISEARDRLGWEPVRAIFRRHAAELDGLHGKRLWHGMRLFGLDGTTFRAADSSANLRCFGVPRTPSKTRCAWPQFRAVFLADVSTHLLREVVMGPYSMGELKIAEYLLDRLPTNSVLLLDRAFHTFVWPARLSQRGVYFVLRAKKGTRVAQARLVKNLGPGDDLCALGSAYTKRKWPDLPDEVRVRVITRKVNGHPVTVLTNLLSAEDYPAGEIVELYRERWELELGLRELKTYMGEKTVTFRSKTPERVLQEAYGFFIAFNSVRALMCEAADEARTRPLALSFTDCLNTLRTQLPNMTRASPERLREALVREFSQCRLPPRRRRSCPRAVKARPIKYATKKPGQVPGLTRRQKNRHAAELRRERVQRTGSGSSCLAKATG